MTMIRDDASVLSETTSYTDSITKGPLQSYDTVTGDGAVLGRNAASRLLSSHYAFEYLPALQAGLGPLHWAAAQGDQAELERRLNSQSQNVNHKSQRRLAAPLHIATICRQQHIVDFLLAQGADKDVIDIAGDTPLHIATRYHQKEIVARLLSRGADINAQDAGDNTALHLAVQKNDITLVRLLLAKGARFEMINKDGLTPLHLAVKGGNETMPACQLLLADGANITAPHRDGTPLCLAVRQGSTGTVKAFLEHYPNLDLNTANGFSSKFAASAKRDLLSKLHGTSKSDIAELYARHEEETVLGIAALHGHTAIVQLILTRGADREAQGSAGNGTPLYMAAATGRVETLKILLQAGAAPNAMCKKNPRHAPMHVAAGNGELAAMEILLEAGALIGAYTARTAPGPMKEQPPTLSATEKEKEAFIGAGYTPLHHAARNNQPSAIEWLLQHGAQVDVGAWPQQTALRIATNKRHIEVMRVLLKHGANKYFVHSDGHSAQSVAVRAGNREIMEVLRDAEQKVYYVTVNHI